MLELPEAAITAEQLNETIKGKKVYNVIAASSPHKFAFFYGEPDEYYDRLRDRVVGEAKGHGGLVEVKMLSDNEDNNGEGKDVILLLGDGARTRYHQGNDEYPKKHQLLIEFDDGTAISISVQMYGGIWCFEEGTFENEYYDVAKDKPSPLSPEFDKGYFLELISDPVVEKKSAKAFLATEQRIPGLGNGSLQDILFNARIHPKRKINTLTDEDINILYRSVKDTLQEMVEKGCRDTEKDVYDNSGGYRTILSRNTVNKPCTVCGTTIKKKSYMGGAIYFCEGCQKL